MRRTDAQRFLRADFQHKGAIRFSTVRLEMRSNRLTTYGHPGAPTTGPLCLLRDALAEHIGDAASACVRRNWLCAGPGGRVNQAGEISRLIPVGIAEDEPMCRSTGRCVSTGSACQDAGIGSKAPLGINSVSASGGAGPEG